MFSAAGSQRGVNRVTGTMNPDISEVCNLLQVFIAKEIYLIFQSPLFKISKNHVTDFSIILSVH